MAGEASREENAANNSSSSSNNDEKENEDDDRKTADKAGCNFIRQRRILIRIPPLDRANESGGKRKRRRGRQFLSGK